MRAMKGRKQTFIFIIWRKLNFEPFPDTALDFFPEGKHLVHFKQKKLKSVTHTARPRMKSRKVGI